MDYVGTGRPSLEGFRVGRDGRNSGGLRSVYNFVPQGVTEMKTYRTRTRCLSGQHSYRTLKRVTRLACNNGMYYMTDLG
jgi:hypothetical protein